MYCFCLFCLEEFLEGTPEEMSGNKTLVPTLLLEESKKEYWKNHCDSCIRISEHFEMLHKRKKETLETSH